MSKFEFTFIVDPLSEELEDRLLDAFDCLPGQTHGGRNYLTIAGAGANAIDAAQDTDSRLREHGVHILRIEPDLVMRAEIAVRLEVTRQAIGNWIRGDRQRGKAPFPETFHDTGGGIWLWTDVVAWVREHLAIDPAPGIEFPSRSDIDSLNVSFAATDATVAVGMING